MTIKYVTKDVTTVTNGIVLHGCNCLGIMGSGVALAIKRKWPLVYSEYAKLCKAADDPAELLGSIQFVPADYNSCAAFMSVEPFQCVAVINGFTQVAYGSPDKPDADVDAIKQVLLRSVGTAANLGMPLYTVKIGSLRGGLDWETQVLPIFEAVSSDFPLVDIYVCDI